MQVPKVQGMDVSAQGIPGVRVGTSADAASFGANQYRDLRKLAGAVQGVGDAVLAEAQKRQKIEDDAFVTNRINQAHVRFAEESANVYEQFRGEKSVNAPAEIGKVLQSIQNDLDRGLQNQNQREAFSRSFSSLSGQAQVGAVEYRDKEIQNEQINARLAQNALISKEAAAKVLAAGGVAAVLNGPERGIVTMNIDKLTEGQSAEFRELKRQEALTAFDTEQLTTLAAQDPARALDYLADERVQGVLGVARVGELREKYETARIKIETDQLDSEAALWALDEIKNNKGEMPLDLKEKLIRKFGRKRAELAYADANAQVSVFNTQQTKEMAIAAEERWNTFLGDGEGKWKIPNGIPYKEKLAMMRAQKLIASGGEKGDPWAVAQSIIDKYSPEDLRDAIRNGAMGEIFPKLLYGGKDVGEKARLLNYAFNGTRGGTTALAHARQQFIAVTGIKPTGKNAQKFNQFIDEFTTKAEFKAGQQKLKNVNQLSRDDQDAIISDLLTQGDSRWFDGMPFAGWLSSNKYRFELEPTQEDSFKPFEQKDQPYYKKIKAPPSPAPTNEAITRQGVKQTSENGKVVVRHPTETVANSSDMIVPEPGNIPPEVKALLGKPGSKKNWTGDGWIITVPGEGTSIWAANGIRMG